MLSGLRQSDATELVDAYLSMGLLQQDEVNLHRPTVRLSKDVQNGVVSRMSVIARMRLSPSLIKRLSELNRGAGSEAGSSQPDSDEKAKVIAATPSSPVAQTPAATNRPAMSDAESPSTAAGAGAGTSSNADDWSWTWQLLVDGYAWTEVMSIRRKSDLEVAADLQQALRQNKTVQKAWLTCNLSGSNDLDTHPTVGQQRLLRELQRRSAAGV